LQANALAKVKNAVKEVQKENDEEEEEEEDDDDKGQYLKLEDYWGA